MSNNTKNTKNRLSGLPDLARIPPWARFGPDGCTTRLDELKDVPTTAELGMPEINYTMWHGLYVAKGTPKEIIAALNDALRKAVSDPDVVAKFKQLGTLPYPEKEVSPEAHARLFAADLPR